MSIIEHTVECRIEHAHSSNIKWRLNQSDVNAGPFSKPKTMETRRDQRVYKFNITQHHDPYISCFVIMNHLIVKATTS